MTAHSIPSLTVRTVRLPGGPKLEVAEQGARDSATTLLMLHGITDSWRSFEPVLPWLPPEWHVIVPSQRGHGASGHEQASSYHTADFARDAASLLDVLGVERPVVVVGHSMGAANALQLAADHPDRVAALVLAGAFASFADKPDLVAFHRDTIAPLRDPVPHALAYGFQADTVAGTVPPGLLEAMTQESLKLPAAVWRAAFAGLFEDPFVPLLGRVRCPSLLVRGDADAFVPHADAARLLASLPDARLITYRGTGHALHWEQPSRFARDVVQFVLGVADRPAAAA